jgi:hypothetical protein
MVFRTPALLEHQSVTLNPAILSKRVDILTNPSLYSINSVTIFSDYL